MLEWELHSKPNLVVLLSSVQDPEPHGGPQKFGGVSVKSWNLRVRHVTVADVFGVAVRQSEESLSHGVGFLQFSIFLLGGSFVTRA